MCITNTIWVRPDTLILYVPEKFNVISDDVIGATNHQVELQELGL